TTISSNSSNARIPWAGSSPSRPIGDEFISSDEAGLGMSPSFPVKRIPGDRQQDDQTLNGFFPLRLGAQKGQVGIRAQEDQGRRNRAEQGHADRAAGQGAPP